MFKALDIWMAELEKEFYEDYMRAHDALEDWKNAKHIRNSAKQINVWDIRESLLGDYHSYCCMYVTDKYREEIVEHDGIKWAFLIDTLVIDDKEYEIVMAQGKVRGQEDVQVNWTVERRIEEKFKEELSQDKGWGLFLQHRRAYVADVKLVEGRDEPWIRTRAHKDMIRHKEAIEAKIMKICDQIDSVMDEFGEYYIKGTNGKFAHVWRVVAGGYNIQRRHTRCLCKEVKK